MEERKRKCYSWIGNSDFRKVQVKISVLKSRMKRGKRESDVERESGDTSRR